MEKVTKLFITHTVWLNGGANNSLRQLISNLNEKVDLIAPVSADASDRKLRDFFGKNVRKIYRFDLPRRKSYVGGKVIVKEWLMTEKRYARNRKRLYDVMKKYRFIHLNSNVLYPLITKRLPVYVHIREIFEGGFLCKKYVQHRISKAKGVIYIDSETKSALDGHFRHEIVLNNPFDQTKVREVDLCKVREKYGLGDETVFAFVVAAYLPAKGMEFVIDAFRRAHCTRARLLIVGDIPADKRKTCDRVSYLGALSNMNEIYAVSDYIIRGDTRFCIGRTIYEGLYSGCHVIIPGSERENGADVFEYERFKDSVLFYRTRDEDDLARVLRERETVRKKEVLGLRNTDAYVKSFYRFIGERG